MAQDPTTSTGKTINAVIQTRHDTSANMASKVYEGGELFYETDTKKLKIGDGTTRASSIEALNKSYTFTDGVKESNGTVSVDYDKVLSKPSGNGVVIKNTSGVTTNGYGTGATANYIVQRDANGQITVPLTPTDQAHAVPKKYVDDTKSTLQTNIDGKIAFSNLNESAPTTDEETLKYIYDEAGDKQWTIPQGTYSKPASGIPKSDLDSGVQTSLGKADTAIQSHQSIKTLNTSATSSQAVNTSETIAGSGSITLHRVSKTGEFQHLRNRGESFLEWGGTNLQNNNVSPLDAALIPELGANRLAFAPAAGITVEYSRDSGTTWVDYGATDAQKLLLTTNGTKLICGGSDVVAPPDAKRMLRITFSSVTAKIYTVFRKFAIYIGSSGSSGCYLTLRCRTHANVKNNVDTWTTFADKQPISGNGGWDIINTNFITYSTTDSQYEEFQFIFGYTGIGYSSGKGLEVNRILGFGGAGWITPSTMAATGNLYSFNSSKEATFPAKVTATQLASNVADGTAPITVRSSTLVSNLNSDLLDGQQGSYYLNYNNFSNKPTLVSKVSVTGNGNAVTTGSVSVDTITLTKGSTFAELGDNTFNGIQSIYQSATNAPLIDGRDSGTNKVFVYPDGFYASDWNENAYTQYKNGSIVYNPGSQDFNLQLPPESGTVLTKEKAEEAYGDCIKKALSITIY